MTSNQGALDANSNGLALTSSRFARGNDKELTVNSGMGHWR